MIRNSPRAFSGGSRSIGPRAVAGARAARGRGTAGTVAEWL